MRDDVLAGPEAPAAPVAEPEPVAEPAPAAEPAAAPEAAASTPADEQPLFEEIGGAPVVQAAAAAFYEQVLEDATLGKHYADADMAKQQAALVEFLTSNLGPSPKLASGHQWLVGQKGMGDEGFNRCLELFEAALQSQNVPEGLIFRALASIERNRESIVD
ncbi:MAG: hypothetical protein MJE12_25740 [Alphaproteobacteria bacterium]|nr:hypothetical protein [Alphaproteobacteria bacterium]